MDNQNNCQNDCCKNPCNVDCGGGMHHRMYWGRRYLVVRWILGAVLLGLVFTMGVKVGEFKALFENQFGGNFFYHRVMPMMGTEIYGGATGGYGAAGEAVPGTSAGSVIRK